MYVSVLPWIQFMQLHFIKIVLYIDQYVITTLLTFMYHFYNLQLVVANTFTTACDPYILPPIFDQYNVKELSWYGEFGDYLVQLYFFNVNM